MYLFQKAKDSIVNSLHYDKFSPLMKLNYVCKFILKYTFILSFVFLALALSALYSGKDLINENLLKLFAILSFILCILSFTVLKRKNGSHILSKIKMYPFSFKDLIDISLSTGTLTISIFDIFLCYFYLLASLLIFLTAIFSVYKSLENPYMEDNENFNSFTLHFISVSYIGLYIIYQFTVFRTMPYHPLEYFGYLTKNIIDDIFSIIKKAWNLIF